MSRTTLSTLSHLSRSTTRTTQTPLRFLPSRHHLFSTSSRLRNQQGPVYQPPTPPSEPDNPHRAFYKSFGRPIAKVFLMALATYQIIHYSWLRLETMEEKEDMTAEMERLEKELKEAVALKGTKD